MMNVVIRVDASLEIGTGHVMRCLTLASALREEGASCRFVCRPHSGHLIEFIRERGFAVVALPAPTSEISEAPDLDHAAWLATDWRTDAQQTRAAIGEEKPDWLIVDHYALDARWERELRGACCKIMVIDDLADRRHDCDLLLDQNLGRAGADYSALVPERCELLIGPRYAMLRPEFARLREESLTRRSDGKLQNILVTMGGVDKDNAAGRVLDALAKCDLPADVAITVVMGPTAPWLDYVRAAAAKMPRPTRVLVNVRDMARLMADSDLAIGAAGSTSWERCCLGMPSLLLVLATNQESVGNNLAQAGAAELIDGARDFNLRELAPQFSTLILSIQKRFAMTAAAAAITDGCGTSLVSSAMKNPAARKITRGKIVIRPARPEDSLSIWAWRNDPESRANFRNMDVVAWTEHSDWLSRNLNTSACVMLIGLIEEKPAGIVRFDKLLEGVAEVSINVAPSLRGFGVGAELLAASCDAYLHRQPATSLRAEIKIQNTNSQKLFKKCGFECIAVNAIFATFERRFSSG